MSWNNRKKAKVDKSSSNSDETNETKVKQPIININPEELRLAKQEKLNELKRRVAKVPTVYAPQGEIIGEKEQIEISTYNVGINETEVPNVNNDTVIPIKKENKIVKEKKQRKKGHNSSCSTCSSYSDDSDSEFKLDFKKDKEAMKMGVNSLFQFQFFTMMVTDKLLTKFEMHKKETLTDEFIAQRKMFEANYKEILLKYGNSVESLQTILDPITVWMFTTLGLIGTHVALPGFLGNEEVKTDTNTDEQQQNIQTEIKIDEKLSFEY